MSVIICYSTCWGCKFNDHPGGPHTWMDGDDVACDATIQKPATPEDWERLAIDKPCGCSCTTEPMAIEDEDHDDEHAHGWEYWYSVYRCGCGETLEDD